MGNRMTLPIKTICSMLGLNVKEEDIHKLEELIPKIPAFVQQVIVVVNQAITQNHERLLALETHNKELERKMDIILLHIMKETNARRTDPNRLNGECRDDSTHTGTGAD